MRYTKREIKEGIKVHLIKNDNFKTDFTVVFLTLPLEKENITKNALIPAILRSGSHKYETYQKISEELEMLYGASFDCGIDKTGDNLVLKFYIESINDNYLPQINNNLEKVLEILLDIIFDPKVTNDEFEAEYIEIEKRNLEMIIKAQKDDKDQYAYDRCINIMYNNSGYGLSKYGNLEDLQAINSHNLYEQYKQLIDNAKIDIIISGDYEEEKILNYVETNELIKKLNPRKEKININKYSTEIKDKKDKANEINEKLDIVQGKLVIGLDILPNELGDFRFISILYNAIFGNGVSSKLFQIVREKESLAYTAKSEYIAQKNNIFIRCGIECQNYEKATELIKKLLEDMKNGEFSEEDITKAKDYILAGVDAINEEQDSQILFLFGQELTKMPLTIEEHKNNIQKVTKEQIVEFANKIQLNTIYFLKNGGNNADNWK
mgnify:FL=1